MRVEICCPEMQAMRKAFNANMTITDKLAKVQEACKLFEESHNYICATKCKKWEERLVSRMNLWEEVSACIDNEIDMLRKKIEKKAFRILKREKEIETLKSQENDMKRFREMGLEDMPELESITAYIDALIRKNKAALAKKQVGEEKLQDLLQLKAKIVEARCIAK